MTSFNPNWASPPGHTVSGILEERGLLPEDVATQLGLSQSEMTSLLDGDIIFDTDLAAKVSEFIGGTNEFWMRRDAIWHERRNRMQNEFVISQEELFRLKYLREKVLRLSIEREASEKDLQAEIDRITTKYSEGGIYVVSGNLSLETGVGQRNFVKHGRSAEGEEE